MVKSAIGETVSPEDLGGAYVHTQHSGGCDHIVKSQEEGIKKLRDIIEFEPGQSLYCDIKKPAEPKFDFKEMMRCNPVNTYHAINIKDSLKCIADDSYFHEYKPTYGLYRGETVVAGKMWLKGMPVGVIASSNNGIIYIEAARKATEWMIRCGNSGLPVLFMQGSPGYMVGKSEEWGGIGKYGSDMVRTCSVLNVPKIQYVIGPEGHPFLTGSLLFHDGVIAFSEARAKLGRALELCYRTPIGRTDWGDLKV
jgi:3-methylcrotonyl-CoA carboxylase beta subunit